jgi:hypothetical protein
MGITRQLRYIYLMSLMQTAHFKQFARNIIESSVGIVKREQLIAGRNRGLVLERLVLVTSLFFVIFQNGLPCATFRYCWGQIGEMADGDHIQIEIHCSYEPDAESTFQAVGQEH